MIIVPSGGGGDSAALDQHIADSSNPHNVTVQQTGLTVQTSTASGGGALTLINNSLYFQPADLSSITPNNGSVTIQGTGKLGGYGVFNLNDSGANTISISHDTQYVSESTSTSPSIVITGISYDTYGHLIAYESASVGDLTGTTLSRITQSTYSASDDFNAYIISNDYDNLLVKDTYYGTTMYGYSYSYQNSRPLNTTIKHGSGNYPISVTNLGTGDYEFDGTTGFNINTGVLTYFSRKKYEMDGYSGTGWYEFGGGGGVTLSGGIFAPGDFNELSEGEIFYSNGSLLIKGGGSFSGFTFNLEGSLNNALPLTAYYYSDQQSDYPFDVYSGGSISSGVADGALAYDRETNKLKVFSYQQYSLDWTGNGWYDVGGGGGGSYFASIGEGQRFKIEDTFSGEFLRFYVTNIMIVSDQFGTYMYCSGIVDFNSFTTGPVDLSSFMPGSSGKSIGWDGVGTLTSSTIDFGGPYSDIGSTFSLSQHGTNSDLTSYSTGDVISFKWGLETNAPAYTDTFWYQDWAANGYIN